MRRLLVITLPILMPGCIAIKDRDTRSPEDVLTAYFVLTALGGKSDVDFLNSVYPLRSQLVTFAIIGYHADRGVWPKDADEVLRFAEGSPANPKIPLDALSGLRIHANTDDGVVYSTLEDRQRGREFTISSAHKVTLTVPQKLFADVHSAALPRATSGSTISFDWTPKLIEALTHAATHGK